MEILKDQKDLQVAVQKYHIVIVQFGAECCAPCKSLQNRIKLWNQPHPEACAQMGVFIVSTIFVHVEGKLTLQQSGYFSLDQILQQAEKYEYLLS